MGIQHLNIRAIIFDVYHTLLTLSPAPADAPERWSVLWRQFRQSPPRLSLAEFGAACDRVIAREHATARQQGILHPEVYWPSVVRKAVSDLANLPDPVLDDFLYQHAALTHTVVVEAEAAALLRRLEARGMCLGIASNSQPYTVRELDAALANVRLYRDLFVPALCFFSFEYGFSKPEPHVFHLLEARLAARGIPPAGVLMVGDHADCDIAPAKARGWHTWHLTRSPFEPGTPAGDWRGLSAWLGLP